MRSDANIILTNPDTLHLSVLPHHTEWAEHLRHLRYIVVDEAHVYCGLFGSHVSCILRRLWRLCCAYGNHHVQFICCSATLANPAEHAARLLPTKRATVIREDSSASGNRVFALWNPARSTKQKSDPTSPAADIERSTTSPSRVATAADAAAAACHVPTVGCDPAAPPPAAVEPPTLAATGGSAGGSALPSVTPSSDAVDDPAFGGSSSILECALLLSSLVQLRVKTLVFCTSQKLTELVLSYTQVWA